MIHFFVPGICQPAGSKRALPLGGKLGGRSIIVDANRKAKPWQDTVRAVAQEHRPELLLMEPLEVTLNFVMPRPGYHYKKDGSIKPSAPYCHSKKPDALKLARAVEDSLTGVVWQDDALTSVLTITKVYTMGTNDPPGVHVCVATRAERARRTQ